ncbi:MAG: hypothetical protein HS104_14320 [Polyangiaceae bacterium]|nr:hypothetical protein [Polyangiaceae bacterium]MCL4748914.1 hypothetical protein [Myxococcales bacterium]
MSAAAFVEDFRVAADMAERTDGIGFELRRAREALAEVLGLAYEVHQGHVVPTLMHFAEPLGRAAMAIDGIETLLAELNEKAQRLADDESKVPS